MYSPTVFWNDYSIISFLSAPRLFLDLRRIKIAYFTIKGRMIKSGHAVFVLETTKNV
jgi:hypothetical protein